MIIVGIVLSSILSQKLRGEKINFKEAIISAVGGGIKGAIAGSGIGIVAGTIATGATGAATNVATQVYAEGKQLNKVDWWEAILVGAIDAAIYGHERYKVKGKGPTVQDQLRKTNDDVHKENLHLAGYGKKRMKGKSYKRTIRKVNELKQLQKVLAKKWMSQQIKETEKNIVKDLEKTWLNISTHLASKIIINNNQKCIA